MGTGGSAGNTTTYSYDTVNNRTAVALPTGAARTAMFTGGAGCASTDTRDPYQAKCVTDAQGSVSSATYDAAGNVTRTQDTTGGTAGTATTYSRQGVAGGDCGGKTGQVCAVTDGNGHVTRFSYDSDGNQVTTSPPAPLGTIATSYDSMGRVTAVTQGKNQTTRYTYDKLDHQLSLSDAHGESVSYGYDSDGNRTSQDDTAGGSGVSSYGYDALNRQVSLRDPNMTAAVQVSLDAAGNRTALTGRTAYTCDDAGQVIAVAQPGASCPADGVAAAGCTRIDYNANGNRTALRFPGGVTQHTSYDDSSRPTRIRAVGATGQVMSDVSYTYASTSNSGYNPTARNTAKDTSMIASRTDAVGIGSQPGPNPGFSRGLVRHGA